jgi:hypothetical protein
MEQRKEFDLTFNNSVPNSQKIYPVIVAFEIITAVIMKS